MADWLVLDGKRYPLDGFTRLDLDQLDQLEEVSGLTVDQINQSFAGIEDYSDLFKSRERRHAVKTLIWANRTAAGDEVGSLAEAVAALAWSSIRIESDDPEESADPTQEASDPVADGEPAEA